MRTAPAPGPAPGKQRCVVLVEPGRVRVEERPTPSPGPGEVLVRVASVGVCGSDVHYYDEGRIGDHVVTAPLVLGHESSGTVVAVGEGVHDRAPGQRVAVEPGVPCGRCRPCRTGAYNLCPDVRFLATPPVDGAFTEYLAVPEAFAHPVPDALSDDAAALLEPTSVAVWAVRKAGVALGDRVLVTGAGPVGLLVAMVARAAGAQEVTVTDVVPERRAAAARHGVTRVLDPAEASPAEVVEADVLVECSGVAAAVGDGVAAVRPGGTAVLVGMGAARETLLPTQLLQTREITLTGTFRYAHTYPTAIALAESGAVDLDALVSGHYRLQDVEDALTAARRDPTVVKPVVVPVR
jgi:L-iditol 2-dehydrogenase